MINNKVLTVVMPAYNAEKTLAQTLEEVPMDIVDHIILVDDKSRDNTVETALQLGIEYVITHEENKGYGANQKTCYDMAIDIGSDIVIMLHPDYQYTPKLIHAMAYIIADDVYKVVFGSRILGNDALKNGMPLYKYLSNRFLTFIQNLLMHKKLSEYHTGYRVFSTEVLKNVNYHLCSDDFIFDNQIIAQIFHKGYEIAEVTCPTKYFADASSINFKRSLKYGFGCLNVAFRYFMHKTGLLKYDLLQK